ncbi:MAG: hypothetical protein J6U28_00290 [Bacteroidales bacterium]|nr:hypothetical protein [Bacteroidales bacterium]
MSKKISSLFFTAIMLLSGLAAKAQDGTYSSYSPYSVFGVGNLSQGGTSYNATMGGVGIAARDHRYLNIVNPASITERDSLSVLADFGLVSDNRLYRQGDVKSANNLFNIKDIAASFPLSTRFAISAALMPFSSTGYKFTGRVTDPEIVGNIGNVTYESEGNGGIYQAIFGFAGKVTDNLSVGVQGIYYFGKIEKTSVMNFSGTGFRNRNTGYNVNVNAIAPKFGVQYVHRMQNGIKLTAGATYRMAAAIKGDSEYYKIATMSSISDTLAYSNDKIGGNVKIADEFGIGFSVRSGDKWMAEVDYTFSDWSGKGIDNTQGFSNLGDVNFSATASQMLRAGFELVPNRNDVRSNLRRWSYRAGLYYGTDYFKLDGKKVKDCGLTFGVTIPVFRWYNGLTVGVNLGQRGSYTGNMTREQYAKFSIGFNLHDIWFQKPRYE